MGCLDIEAEGGRFFRTLELSLDFVNSACIYASFPIMESGLT